MLQRVGIQIQPVNEVLNSHLNALWHLTENHITTHDLVVSLGLGKILDKP